MIHAHKCWMGTRSTLMLLGYCEWCESHQHPGTPTAEGDRRTCPSPSVSITSTGPGKVAGESRAPDPARRAKQRAGFFISYLSADIKL